MGECVHHSRFEDHIKESDKYRDKIILNESEINHMRVDVKEIKDTTKELQSLPSKILTRVAFIVGGINLAAIIADKLT